MHTQSSDWLSRVNKPETIFGFVLIVGILVSAWFLFSPLEMPHVIECRSVRGEYLTAQTSVARLEAETRFKAAGCKGSIFNTFLPAH
jgi:hypothetical protein